MIPGEWFISDEPVEINAGRPTVQLMVTNTGDRPIQVGSHYHFFEANRALLFDRPESLGKRLNVPAGKAIRFEPGEEKEVELVTFGGAQRIVGFNELVGGAVTAKHTATEALRSARNNGYLGMQDWQHPSERIAEHGDPQ